MRIKIVLELKNLWNIFNLHQKGISLADQFIQIYEKINRDCWAKYRKDELTKIFMGPFSDYQTVQTTLKSVKDEGFSDAFITKKRL